MTLFTLRVCSEVQRCDGNISNTQIVSTVNLRETTVGAIPKGKVILASTLRSGSTTPPFSFGNKEQEPMVSDDPVSNRT